MKIIATAGKGGTGKTTILFRYLTNFVFQDNAVHRCLIVDADPHMCLSSALFQKYNLSAPPLAQAQRESQFDLQFVSDSNQGGRDVIAADTVSRAVAHVFRHGVMAMGANDQPGCQCVVNSLLGRALDSLFGQYGIVFVDNEAGIEHIGRHAWPIDCLLLSTSSRRTDQDVARLILRHAQTVGRDIRHILLLWNDGVGNDGDESIDRLSSFQAEMEGFGVEKIFRIPLRPQSWRDATLDIHDFLVSKVF